MRVPDIAQALLRMRPPRDREQTVISLGLPFALLLDLKDSDNAAGKDDAWESRRVMDHHDVERITVIGFRRWHEPPVMGIGQSRQEGF